MMMIVIHQTLCARRDPGDQCCQAVMNPTGLFHTGCVQPLHCDVTSQVRQALHFELFYECVTRCLRPPPRIVSQ